MHKGFRDLKGKIFGRLTVLRISAKNETGHYSWLCSCSCGAEKIIQSRHLINGNSRSCGCLQKEEQSKRKTTHGLCKNKNRPVYYSAWGSIISRCYNKNDAAYKYYGGKGIKMCDRWKNDFTAFVSDIGERPSLKHSIDRIDNNADYCPENFRWSTMREQCKNRISNSWLEFKSEKLIQADWARKLNIHPSRLSFLLKRMSLEQIIQKLNK